MSMRNRKEQLRGLSLVAQVKEKILVELWASLRAAYFVMEKAHKGIVSRAKARNQVLWYGLRRYRGLQPMISLPVEPLL